MVTHACNTSTQDVKAGGLGVRGHLWLHSMFKASLAYTKPCLRKERMEGGEEGRSGGGREKRGDRNGKKKGGSKKRAEWRKVCLGLGFRYLRPVASAPLESQSVLTFSAFSASHSSSKANSSLLRFVHREPSRSPARGQSACAMAVNAGAKAPGTQQTAAIFLLSVLLFAEYHIIHLSSNLVLKHDVRGFSRFTPCATVPASPHSTGGPENTKRLVVPLSICQLSESPLPDSHMVDQSFPTSPPNVEEPLVPEASRAERLNVVHVAFSARAPLHSMTLSVLLPMVLEN